ncbi:lipopolysaccharide biosynthesis protein [Ruminococcus flavefaciens]|uniref:lipopolysaccharide biosynthesis protein n=1 Tax=Ruminococcus flavefaciens TaxID=1265 RepID=UPI000685EB3F|nr:oligosaccharide flippase family protein [Ruminococcus flavefaciens]
MKEREMSRNKQLFVNLIASFMSYVITFGISFFLSPYIVRKVGVEAYGFVSLANNFVGYASLITIALDTLAGRFITIRIYEKDYEGANKYFSSVFIANSFISAFLLIVSASVWFFLERLIQIPDQIFWDIKILFAALFLNCIISTFGSVFAVATFAKNKLYLNSLRTVESSVVRGFVLVVLFSFFAPNVCYLGITSLLTGIYCFAYNVYYTKKLLPFIHIKKKYFDFSSIIELISSGVWNVLIRLGQLLSDGLDLLITNIFIDATSMGVLSLAKTIPSLITSIVGTLVGVFSPSLTILYAEKKMDELVRTLKQSMRIMGIIVNLPIIVLIVCGENFFLLWQPTQDARVLHILSVLTCAGYIISGGINCVYNIFTVVNKLKVNSLSLISCGFINILIVFILLKTTNLGIYAVAGISTIINTLKNLIIIVPYSAKCLNLKWYAFYPDVIRPFIFVFISCLLNYTVLHFFDCNSWLTLIVHSFITLSVSTLIGCFIILRKQDRKYLSYNIKKGLDQIVNTSKNI